MEQTQFFAAEPCALLITLDVAAGALLFDWSRPGATKPLARGQLNASPHMGFFSTLGWVLETGGQSENDACQSRGSSPRALVKRIQKRFPVPDASVCFCVLADRDIGPAKAGVPHRVDLPPDFPAWQWLGKQVQAFAQLVDPPEVLNGVEIAERARRVAYLLACAWLRQAPEIPQATNSADLFDQNQQAPLDLRIILDTARGFIQLDWTEPTSGTLTATGWIRCTGLNELSWWVQIGNRQEHSTSTHHLGSIRAALNRWFSRFPAAGNRITAYRARPARSGAKPSYEQMPLLLRGGPAQEWLEEEIQGMAEALRINFSPAAKLAQEMDPLLVSDLEREERRLARKEQKRAEEEAQRQATMARLAEERRRREEDAALKRKAAEARKAAEQVQAHVAKAQAAVEHPPLPPIPVRFELPPLEIQETTFTVGDLQGFSLRERASLWWVSNQSDDLLCLPYCRIQRLEYQVRTALRVLGPLRGRALLSDEVGLGKTIEAGLVLKELLTRGMVKRFLVLTVPSLVDQWEEEMSEKFGLATATTNQAGQRDNADQFWRENPGIIASLHTLKQPAQLAIARQVHWDLLIVDEAHYLRNRESQAWQAINVLPRQFLLLLTATPVQNSLEELYNLVTLLQPGQLPSPREFRARFIDPKRPRQPREPEELRRLLGQVMIRNTRANAGIQLPPRRAETVLFEPDETERAFWQKWDRQFRDRLAQLSPGQASLWGRLLLQAAGSSPAAWRDALEKFPDRAAARTWREQSPLEASWERKCRLLPPLTQTEGGVVIFTQFLQTQTALAEYLRAARVQTFLINGATPPPERQPITEEFHRHGGALILTHSGTEGRNLQFAHRLANFDLPWNPMEIEQRIGRLHRLGQRHPVRIYNFVQAGTLQEHLLQILQEKLNLFELVVGETGLVLGEKFSSDEFAEEVLRRWRESEGRVAEALAGLGEELAAARDSYNEVKQLDETLFEKDYESL